MEDKIQDVVIDDERAIDMSYEDYDDGEDYSFNIGSVLLWILELMVVYHVIVWLFK